MKPFFALPLIALAAWLSAPLNAYAPPISNPSIPVVPPARGLIILNPCNVATVPNGCPYQVYSLQFPPDQVSETLTDGPGNSATATISIQPSATLPGVTVTTVSAGATGSYGSTVYVSFMYYFAVITPRGTVAFPHLTISAGRNVLG